MVRYSVPYKETSSEEVRFCCPRCGDSKFHLYYNPRKDVYYCQRCNYKGRGLPDGLKVPPSLPPEPQKRKSRRFPLRWSVLQDPPSCVLESVVWSYLHSRGVSNQDIADFSLGWTSEIPFSVVIPITLGGELKALQVRRLIGKPKYIFYDVDDSRVKKSTLVYNFDRVMKGVETLYVVEGVFDVIRAVPLNGVCVFGKEVALEQALLISQVPRNRTVLAFDPEVEVSGLVKSVTSLGLFGEVYIKVLPLDKDPADLGKDFISFPERTLLERGCECAAFF